jgi:hypothetical protein
MAALLFCLIMFGPALAAVVCATRRPPALVIRLDPWKFQIRTVPGMIPFPRRTHRLAAYTVSANDSLHTAPIKMAVDLRLDEYNKNVDRVFDPNVEV